jgi:hypothetical protein
MRVFAIAADVAMGLILGAFLYAALAGMWPVLKRPFVLAVVLGLSIVIVLFRRPHGSLARRPDGR